MVFIMNHNFEQTRKYADEINEQRELINHIKYPMRKFWSEVECPETDVFAKHVLHFYDIDLSFDLNHRIVNVIINDPKKYTMFLLKYG